MDADQLVSFILEKKWLALAILVIGYITRLLSDDSKFPVSVPARFHPLVVTVLGQVLGALMMIQGGASWKVAVLTGLAVSFCTMGLFDLLVKAIFNGSPPWWIDILALVFPKSSGGKLPPPPKVPPGLGVLTLLLAFLLTACSWLNQNASIFPTPKMIFCVANEVNNGDTDPKQIIKACPDVAQLALDDLQKLIDGEIAAKAARAASAADGGAK